MKKTLSAIIALLMIASALIACGETPVNPEDTTAAVVATEDSSASQEEQTTSLNNIPADLKYNGVTVNILYWSDVERPEFFVEEENGEKVNDALWKKNILVEEQLGVKLNWVGTPGNYGNQAAFVAKAEAGASDTDPYDAHAGYSLSASTLTTHGLCQDMTQYEILDFTKPWWPESLINTCKINDKLYFCSGDISTNMLYMMYATFFNKQIYKNVHGDESAVYGIVNDKKWTVDQLIELSKGAYIDSNANGANDWGDTFGFETIDLHFDAFYVGAALNNLEKDADGNLIISEDISSDKAYQYLSKVITFLKSSGDAYGLGTNSSNTSYPEFAAGRILFTFDRVYMSTFEKMKASDIEYGILPIPMYDESQSSYRTCMAFPFTMYSIAKAGQNKEAMAAVLQLLGYEGYDLVTPALFEETMKLRYSKEANDSMMYDVIRENIVIDLGRVFCSELENYTYSLWRAAVRGQNTTAWSSQVKVANKRMTTLIKTLNEKLNALN